MLSPKLSVTKELPLLAIVNVRGKESVYCKKLLEKYREVVIEPELISHKAGEHKQVDNNVAYW